MGIKSYIAVPIALFAGLFSWPNGGNTSEHLWLGAESAIPAGYFGSGDPEAYQSDLYHYVAVPFGESRQEHCFWQVTMPSWYDGSPLRATIVWPVAGSSSAYGQWELRAVRYGFLDYNGPGLGEPVRFQGRGGWASVEYVEADSFLVIRDAQPGDVVMFKLSSPDGGASASCSKLMGIALQEAS
jgi:hypothetical protein